MILPPDPPFGAFHRHSLSLACSERRHYGPITRTDQYALSTVSYQFNTDECVFRNPMICPSARATSSRWSLKRIPIGGLASSTDSKDCSPLITWRRSLPAALLPILRLVTLGEYHQLLLRRIIVVHPPRTNPSIMDPLRVDINHSHPNPIIPI